MSQLTLTSDPLGTATTGTFEFENPAFFMTGATSQRGAVLVDQYTVLQATNTLTSQTAAQALFDVTGSGQVTLVAGTYEFECVFSLSSMSGSSGSFGFALGGGATLTQYWWALANKATLATAATGQVTYNTAANTTLVTANTNTVAFARIHGVVIVTVGGTLIPQVSLGAAAAAVVGVGSFFKIRALGSSAATTSGNWS
tara:strand:+ start:6338 stop:6934 length:597 start_codon:yes stop_codon:yes gene_type:complete